MQPMKNYLIVQNTIMHYREPLYELMSQHDRVQLTVVHSDEAIKHKKFTFNVKYIPAKTFGGLVYQGSLSEELEKYDIVLCMFNLKWISILNCALNPTTNKKIFLWSHGYGKSNLLNIVRVFFVQRCKGLVLYYKEHSEVYNKFGVSKAKIFESSNTLHVPNHGFNEKSIRNSFLYVGRIQDRKKIDLLIISFHKLVGFVPNIHLDVVGAGDELNTLKRLVVNLKIDSNVTFHGECTDEVKLKKLFQKALAYVSPGHVGLGVLHAFSYGCPVVTNSTEYHAPEYVNLSDGHNSLLYDNLNSSLDTTLKMLVETKGLSQRLGSEAYKLYSTKRTISVMANNLINLLDVLR